MTLIKQRICCRFNRIAIYGAVMLVTACGTFFNAPKNTQALSEILREKAARYDADKKYIRKLTSEPYGKKGLFYLIGSDGRVKVHPVKSLEGLDLKMFPFYKAMESGKSGCTLFSSAGKGLVIFYRKTESGEILCLSIPQDEVKGNMSMCSDFGR